MKVERPGSELEGDKAKVKPPETPKSPNPRLWRYLGMVISLWVVLIVAAWFAVHRPFSVDVPIIPASAEIAGAVGRTLADLLLLAAMAIGCGAVGLRWLALAGLEAKLAGPERALFAFGLGLGTAIFAVLLIGVAGGLNWPLMYGLLAAFLLLNPRQSWWIIKGLRRLSRNIWGWFVAAVWWERVLALYLALALLVPLLIGLGPVFSWDALMYHLAVPKLYVEAGRIGPTFELPPASYPFGIEMLFTWALVLRGDGLAQIVHWLFGALGAAAIWVFALRFFDSLDTFGPRARQRGALLAVTLYLSVPHVQLLASWPYTDLMIAFYALLGVFALFLAVQSAEKALSYRWMALAGVFGGLAFSGKYTVLVVVAAMFAAGLYYAAVTKRLNWSRFWGWSFTYGAAALAVALPWLVRNWFFTGNPVAPLFWGVNGWHPDEIAPIVGKGAALGFSPEIAFGRPFKAAIFGTASGDMDATITPLYLAFMPLSIWAAFKNKIVASLLLCVGVQYAGWLAVIASTAQLDHTRILLPTFPFLALVTGYALITLPSLRLDMVRVFSVIALAIFLLGNVLSVGLWFGANDTIPYLTGMQTKSEYLDNILGPLMRASRFVNSLPANSYTFFFFEPRSYYFDRHVAPDLNGGEFFYFLDNQPTPDKIQAELKRRGVTHLLIWDSGLKFLQENPNYVKPERAQAATQLLNAYKAKYLKPLYEEKGQYSVYELLNQ